MLRWILPPVVAVFAVGTAAAGEPVTIKPADAPVAAKPVPAKRPVATNRATVRAASQLPRGLPRAGYKYRTTVAPATGPRDRQWVVGEEPELLISPVATYSPLVWGTPILPGSSTLPGYYGNWDSYSYDGPYYGGPYTSTWNRLPYACGVYGYC